MKTHTINTERLGHLADELLSKHQEWYEYRIDVTRVEKPGSIIESGTMPTLIVVINESINVFPDDWIWHPDYEIVYYKKDKSMNPCSSAMMFYELDFLMFKHLFVPFNQLPFYFGGKMLGFNITPADIGNNIRAFIKTYKTIMN